jgi:hypothetical protein
MNPMPAKTTQFLVCRESFVGFYDGDGLRQFIGRKGITIIEADSDEARTWAKYFEPAKATRPFGVEQATAAPGELRSA